MLERLQPLETTDLSKGVVYFQGVEGGDRIKVGWSSDAKRRRMELSGQLGTKLTLLAAVRGTYENEQRVLSYFKNYQIKDRGSATELLRPSEPVLDYIAWLRDRYFVSINYDDLETETGRVVMDADTWLPCPQFISKRRSELDLLKLADPWSLFAGREITGDDYYTPPEIINIVYEIMGTIDLDPATHVLANQIVKADTIYTKAQNGLTQPWFGNVWLNPPFSEWAQWIEKVLNEIANIKQIIMIGATRTLTARYYHELLKSIDAICIISGRSSEWWGTLAVDAPPDGHFLLYYGPNLTKFYDVCSKCGVVFIAPKPNS